MGHKQMSANDKQFGGDHYKNPNAEEHWDFTWRMRYNQFEYCATKYVLRCWKKNGLQDLEKARHHLEKYLEVGPEIKLSCIQDMVRFQMAYELVAEQRNILNLIHVGLIETAIGLLDIYIESHELPRTYVNPDL